MCFIRTDVGEIEGAAYYSRAGSRCTVLLLLLLCFIQHRRWGDWPAGFPGGEAPTATSGFTVRPGHQEIGDLALRCDRQAMINVDKGFYAGITAHPR